MAQTNDWAKRIVSKTEHPISEFVNPPHNGDITVLIVDGKRFERVRGTKPFYLPITDIKAILFVVVERDYSATFHVFKMESDEDIAIHVHSTVFGQSIGSGSSNYLESVQRDQDGQLRLTTLRLHQRSLDPNLTNLFSTKDITWLDLSKKSVTAHKYIFYDVSGKILREHDESLDW
jgi:hypothetical protein